SDGDALLATPASNVIEFGPRLAESEAAALVQEAPDSAVSTTPEEITIGDVTLSMALYRILCDEAQQHLAVLDAELQMLQFDPAATVSQMMIRASHTLCGIHRTGGFALVASTAKALELSLLALQARGAPLPSTAQPVLARSIAALHMLAERMRAREAFTSAEAAEVVAVICELDLLRQETTPEFEVHDSEVVAA